MDNRFFERPILNSPYDYPTRYWELGEHGQPTQRILESRRSAEFITPIPKPRKRKSPAEQQQIVFDEGKGLSTEIDIGRRSLAFPVTPPCVRVRTRRFGGLSYRPAANFGSPKESKNALDSAALTAWLALRRQGP